MKHTLLIFVLSVLVTSTSANANSNNEGKDAAIELCQQIEWVGHRQSCYQLVSKAWFFSKNAVLICSTYENENIKMDCMRIIRNKKYLRSEANACFLEDDDLRKNSCLRTLGMKARNQSSVENKLREVLYALDLRNIYLAKNLVLEILRDINIR